jgi:hypothetical protein
MLPPISAHRTHAYSPLPLDGMEGEVPGKLRGRDWRNHYLKHPLGASTEASPVQLVNYQHLA